MGNEQSKQQATIPTKANDQNLINLTIKYDLDGIDCFQTLKCHKNITFNAFQTQIESITKIKPQQQYLSINRKSFIKEDFDTVKDSNPLIVVDDVIAKYGPHATIEDIEKKELQKKKEEKEKKEKLEAQRKEREIKELERKKRKKYEEEWNKYGDCWKNMLQKIVADRFELELTDDMVKSISSFYFISSELTELFQFKDSLFVVFGDRGCGGEGHTICTTLKRDGMGWHRDRFQEEMDVETMNADVSQTTISGEWTFVNQNEKGITICIDGTIATYFDPSKGRSRETKKTGSQEIFISTEKLEACKQYDYRVL